MALEIGKIAVIVENGRWLAVGDSTSPKAHIAYAMLQRQGGIANTVTPGFYDYTVVTKGLTKAKAKLTKVCDI